MKAPTAARCDANDITHAIVYNEGMGKEDFYKHIRTLALKAMFSDDKLMDMLVLKGGNAIDLIYKASSRSSIDLDFSINGDFQEKKDTELRIERALRRTFSEDGYEVVDFKFKERPDRLPENDPMPLWGGYNIEFKLIEKSRYQNLKENPQKISLSAVAISHREHKKFSIDLSKHEFCEEKRESKIDGLTIYVYSPEMIVLEKLRAICQQSDEYLKITHSTHSTPRAHDFFDIYTIINKLQMDRRLLKRGLLKKIFDAKEVPLEILGTIGNYRELHRQGFYQVKDTLVRGEDLKGFDFYFDYALDLIQEITKNP